jgi:cell division protein FtsW (lipid II flippase)
MFKERAVPVPVHVLLLFRPSPGTALISFVISIIPTILSIVYVRPMSYVIGCIIPSALVMLMFIFVKKVL